MEKKKEKSTVKKSNNKTTSDFYVDGYTLYPPEGTVLSEDLKKIQAHISEIELIDKSPEDCIALKIKKASFDETKNPVYALEALLISHKNGLYPPMWVMELLANGFKKYHKSQGTKSLESILKFSIGKGKDTAFKKIYLKARNDDLMFEIYRLVMLFDISINTAAEIVESRLNSIPDNEYNKTDLNIGKLTTDSLLKLYHRHWTKYFKRNDDFYIKIFSKWSNKKKVEYLQQYPFDNLPEKLKKFIKKPS